jgi:hypothetical protein
MSYQPLERYSEANAFAFKRRLHAQAVRIEVAEARRLNRELIAAKRAGEPDCIIRLLRLFKVDCVNKARAHHAWSRFPSEAQS